MEHDVWAIPPGRTKVVHMGSFEPDRWQFAEKLAQYLREEGYEEVEVTLDAGDDDD